MKRLFFSIIIVTLLIAGCKKDKYVAVTHISLDQTSLTLVAGGGTTSLTAIIEPEDATDKTVTWSSDKPNIASVTENGQVVAFETGTANITVATKDGEYKATCTITVTPFVSTRMRMTTASSYTKIYMAGSGTVIIFWGNGSETRTLSDYNEDDWNNSDSREKYAFTNEYNDNGFRTIVVSLILNSSMTDDKITHLNCWGRQIASLDVSTNTKLIYLDCDVNRLTDLDVSNNAKLSYLSCTGNGLANLDISKNHELKYLYCGLNQLTNLDVSKNTALTSLNCYNNKFSSSELDALFETLHGNEGNKTISISRNPGTDDCNRSIATNKGWTFD